MDNSAFSAVDTPEVTEKPPKEYDDKGNLKVKLSPRATATIRELNGHESLVADSYMGNSVSPMAIFKVYALLSLQSLVMDGVTKILPPATKDLVSCFNRAKMFSARELMVLMEAYADAYMGAPGGEEDLKNSSIPPQE